MCSPQGQVVRTTVDVCSGGQPSSAEGGGLLKKRPSHGSTLQPSHPAKAAPPPLTTRPRASPSTPPGAAAAAAPDKRASAPQAPRSFTDLKGGRTATAPVRVGEPSGGRGARVFGTSSFTDTTVGRSNNARGPAGSTAATSSSSQAALIVQPVPPPRVGRRGSTGSVGSSVGSGGPSEEEARAGEALLFLGSPCVQDMGQLQVGNGRCI